MTIVNFPGLSGRYAAHIISVLCSEKNSLPSEVLCLEILFQPVVGLPQQKWPQYEECEIKAWWNWNDTAELIPTEFLVMNDITQCPHV